MRERSEPIGERTEKAMREIRSHIEGMRIGEIGSLLNAAGMKYERSDAAMAETLVIGKGDDSAFRARSREIAALVEVIHTLQRHRIPKIEAGYIIKKLDAIQQFYEREGQGEEG